MKKWIQAGICLIVLFMVAAQPLSAAAKTSAKAKTVKVKVTFVSAELVENNHVGNEWWSGGYVNGKEVGEGSSVTLNLKSTDSLKLKAEAQEQDSIPDNGAAAATVKVSSVTKTLTKSLKVTVTENRGRYSGNTAAWKFTFKIQKL